MADERPFVNVPEGPNEENVYREMNDEEYAVWRADVKVAQEAKEPPHPLIAQLKAMSPEDKQALRALLTEEDGD